LELDLPTVKRIDILGNRSFDDGTLKKRMKVKERRFYHVLRTPRFRRDFLRRDVQALQSFYHRNGFFEAKIAVDSIEKDQKSNSVHIRLLVNEGPQTVVKAVELEAASMFSEDALRKKLKLTEGAPYNPNLLETDRYSLFSNYFEKGYLGAQISYDVRLDSTDVDIVWRISPGEPVRVADIRLEGNERVHEKLIMRELTFGNGEYFNLKKVLGSKQNLYDTGYFYSVEIEPKNLDMTARKVDLMLQVRERKMGYMETGLGVGNVHGNRLFAEWGQRNLVGRGYALNLKTAYAFRLFQDNEYSLSKMDFRSKFVRHEGELSFPHVFSTWNTFALGAFYERDATVEPAIVRAVSFNATVSRRFSRNTSLLLRYALERISRRDVEDQREKSRRRTMELTLNRDTRDFYFNPKKGNYVTFNGRVSGGLLGGEDHFYSLVSSFQSYRTVYSSIVFAYRVRAGYAQVFGDSEETGLPIESRFFAGGGNSVRGYRENSLGPLRNDFEPRGGRVLLLTNMELRFPLPYLSRFNFGGAVFLDGGNVWSSVEEINIDHFKLLSNIDETTYQDYRYGAGFGVRYNTPVGPIRFDTGFPLKKTGDVDYEYWIHISLGQIF
jgi:outer membrane protein insertion porin family